MCGFRLAGPCNSKFVTLHFFALHLWSSRARAWIPIRDYRIRISSTCFTWLITLFPFDFFLCVAIIYHTTVHWQNMKIPRPVYVHIPEGVYVCVDHVIQLQPITDTSVCSNWCWTFYTYIHTCVLPPPLPNAGVLCGGALVLWHKYRFIVMLFYRIINGVALVTQYGLAQSAHRINELTLCLQKQPNIFNGMSRVSKASILPRCN